MYNEEGENPMAKENEIIRLQNKFETKFPNREWVQSRLGWHSIPVSAAALNRRLAWLKKREGKTL